MGNRDSCEVALSDKEKASREAAEQSAYDYKLCCSCNQNITGGAELWLAGANWGKKERDKEWLAEMNLWHEEWRNDTKHFSPTLHNCIEYMRDWAEES